ncbi:hypothetical protein HZS_2863 [Henneguya salminicola]|nr:hypothetical protein HZS_2863 [Henneguya salminicola]
MIFLFEFIWKQKYTTTDFEKRLINAIKSEFLESVRRKLIEYMIVQLNILVNSELLTLVKYEDLNNAIEYIKNQIVDDPNVKNI